MESDQPLGCDRSPGNFILKAYVINGYEQLAN